MNLLEKMWSILRTHLDEYIKKASSSAKTHVWIVRKTWHTVCNVINVVGLSTIPSALWINNKSYIHVMLVPFHKCHFTFVKCFVRFNGSKNGKYCTILHIYYYHCAWWLCRNLLTSPTDRQTARQERKKNVRSNCGGKRANHQIHRQ